MKAIVEQTAEEYQQLSEIKAKVIPLREHISWTRHNGYAHYKFEGNYAPELEKLLGHIPTSNEIIIMVDGGFSHFGATCTVNASDHSFYGRVNTD